MSIETLLKKESRIIDRAIERTIPRRLTTAWLFRALGRASFVRDARTCTESISKPVWNLLDRGGKRWRPALLLLCCEALGGSRKKALKFVAIPELAHNGSLIVDDVEDSSLMRRGKPALHVLFGQDLAINAGNTLYFLPLYPLFRNASGLDTKTKLKAYDVFCEEMLKLSFGQAMDIYWHKGKKRNVSEADYLQMCDYKTGALACMAAKLGAVLAKGTSHQIEALGRFAGTIGVAFQIQDDILNLKPSKGWGKEFGEDIREGKRSLVLLRSLKCLAPADRKKLLKIVDAKKKSGTQVRQAIRLIAQTDAFDYASFVAAALVDTSWREVERLLPASKAKESLRLFADYLITRRI